jgi:hypothetical protein
MCVVYEGSIQQVIDAKLVYINGANEATSIGASQRRFRARRGGDVTRKHTAAMLPTETPQNTKHGRALG